MTNTKKINPEDVLRWFRGGADTHKIAYLLRVSESDVANALARAKENERDQDHTSVSPKREQTMEDG